MIKLIKYLLQSLLIFLFLIIGRIIGIFLNIKIFSVIFLFLGPLFKSKKIFRKNINIYSNAISKNEIDKIFKNMWKNYGMTFIEYVFLYIVIDDRYSGFATCYNAIFHGSFRKGC